MEKRRKSKEIIVFRLAPDVPDCEYLAALRYSKGQKP